MRRIPSRIIVTDKNGKVCLIGDTYKEVADFLSSTVGSVKGRIYDGRPLRGFHVSYEVEQTVGDKRLGGPQVPIIAICKGDTRHYKCLKDASDDLGISESTIRCRLDDGLSAKGYFFDLDFLGAMA